jgi:hypothetical protein
MKRMGRMHKLLRLPPAQRRLLIESMLLLWAVRLGLWLLPFQSLWRFLARMTQGAEQSREVDQALVDQIVWAVRVSSQYVPAATCLTQAVAAKVLLRRCGYPANLCLGVARSKAGEFQAHAWLECRGRVVMGGIETVSHFTPVMSLGEGRR